jgi:hypothetical protein
MYEQSRYTWRRMHAFNTCAYYGHSVLATVDGTIGTVEFLWELESGKWVRCEVEAVRSKVRGSELSVEFSAEIFVSAAWHFFFLSNPKGSQV